MKTFLLIILLISSFIINLINNDFPLGYHPDEVKKISFILENHQDFKHPLLLLQIPRLVNFFLGWDSPEAITFLGRTLNAFYGTLIVLITYLIARKFLKGFWPILAATILGLSPILVIHAHYIKEDILFTLFFLISFWTLLLYKNNQTLKNLLIFSLSISLAISSKYMGIIFLLPSCLLIRSYKRALLFLSVVLIIFLLINYPIITHFSIFQSGFNFEIGHSLLGHNHRGIFIPISAMEYFFGFHYLYSIIPGFTLFFTLAATTGLIFILFKWRSLNLNYKMLLCTPLIYYFIIEISPLKTFPDYMRYSIPLIPFLSIFCAIAWRELSRRYPFFHLLFVTALIYMIYDSTLLVYYLNDDTRAKALIWMKKHPDQFKGDQYALNERGLPCVSILDLREQQEEGVSYLLSSSFFYDRITLAQSLHRKDPLIEKCKSSLDLLFTLPYKEISPAHKSFAFSNPHIRIIDITEKSSPLTEIPS